MRVCVHFSGQKLYRPGSERVKKNPCLSVSVKAMKDLVLDPLDS